MARIRGGDHDTNLSRAGGNRDIGVGQLRAARFERSLQDSKDGESRRNRRIRLRLRRCGRAATLYPPQRPGRTGHRLQPRHARAGRRNSQHQRARRRRRSEIGPRLQQQQADRDVGHEDARRAQDDRRPGQSGRHPVRSVQPARLGVQPQRAERDHHRRQGRIGRRDAGSRRRAGAGGHRWQRPYLRRHRRQGQRRRRRYQSAAGDRALRHLGEGEGAGRPGVRRQEPDPLRRLPQHADDGDHDNARARSSRRCRSAPAWTARSSIPRRWRRSARRATAR